MLQRFKLVAGLAVTTALLVPGVAQAKTTLVEVKETSHAVLHHLESLGLDVTYEGEDRTEVMLHGPEDKQILADTGYAHKVLIEDMDGANDHYLEREDAAQARAERGAAPLSTLPTGRVAYRTLTDINAELQQLATTYPDKVKLFTLSETSLLGKPIYGVEVSHNVATAGAKPSFLLSGVHHAREWPTAEFTLEFVWDLLLNDKPGDDASDLLEKGKLIAVPVVNPDGYDLSRSLQNEQKRKNCRITAGSIPTLAECMAAANVNRGIDINRNYLPFWGGPGSSSSATASNTRGESPASEPEIQGMIDLLNKSNVTVAINNHTPDQRLLRAPSSSNEPGVVADEVVYEALLQRLAKNLPGWPAGPWTDVYYEASSTAEQQAYYAYGAFGFTPEATPGFSARRRSTRRTRTSSTTTWARARGTPTRRCAGCTTTRSRPRRRPICTPCSPAPRPRARSSRCPSRRCSTARRSCGRPASRPRSARSRTRSRRASRCRRPASSSGTSTRRCVRASTTRRTSTSPTTSSAPRPDGTVLERTTLKIARGQVANRSLCTQGGVGGTVPATLGLTLGVPASFGAFVPGVAKDYDASAGANVISTAGDAALSVADPDTTATGKLVNGAFALAAAAARGRVEPGGRSRLRARRGRRLREPRHPC